LLQELVLLLQRSSAAASPSSASAALPAVSYLPSGCTRQPVAPHTTVSHVVLALPHSSIIRCTSAASGAAKLTG
jgi:hypothetical protein